MASTKGPSARMLMTALAAAGLTVALLYGPWAGATHMPANKVAASGSTVEVVGPGQSVPLLKGSMRTSSPADLVFQVTAECAIVTNLMTVGNDTSNAFGQVRIWIELDGTPVAVSGDDTTEPGRVVFCNRAFKSETTLFDDEDATIKTFLKTRAANSFNWLALNVGPGIHEIVVMGELTQEASDNAFAEAAVGKRTLVVEPTQLANDASI